MGKLQQNIKVLIDDEAMRGVKDNKIAQRLIEAGIEIMADNGEITEASRIRPIDLEDGTFVVTSFTTANPADPMSLLAAAFGEMPIEDGDRFIIEIGDNQFSVQAFTGAVEDANADHEHERVSMMNVLTAAAGQFDVYARHHIAKGPEHFDKARRNIDMAAQCFAALGLEYTPPTLPGEAIASIEGFADWKADFQAAQAAPEAEAPIGAAGSALALLKLLHGAESGEKPVLGVEVPLDDADFMKALVELGYILRNEMTDKLTLTTKGKEALGLRPAGVPDLPVEVAAVTGNIEERELSARYIDEKIKGTESWIAKHAGDPDASQFEIMTRVLSEIAREFRLGMHLPAQMIAGRIIPYNEDRSTGVLHALPLQAFFDDVYARNVKAGWWSEITTGEPKKRNVGELFILMITEIVEAYEHWQENTADDKLPQYPGVGVELGDLAIRLADFCGALAAGNVIDSGYHVHNPGRAMFDEIAVIARQYEAIRKTPQAVGDPELSDFLPPMLVGEMVDAKLAFNAKREDHKIENRLKEDGKRT